MKKMVRVVLLVLSLATVFTLAASTAGVGLYTFFLNLDCKRDCWVIASILWGLICGLCLVAAAWIPLIDWFNVDDNDLTAGGTCVHG